ncbi:MAG: TIGR03986 family CRISPR-associated RAMP protein [Streptosporangiaceae bacterium]|nr:TIGR03986 family CRISPR-associated RAMP protein [Streptosporangiaceae bacterium]
MKETERRGGAPNPYTFIPTSPRTGLPEGLGDGPPPSHGLIDPATQWSGWLVLRLVTRTPLLLPDAEAATADPDKHATYPVRVGPDGLPLLHGASVKGALRSAYEAVTGSRYGVFRGHERALAYRRPASRGDRPDVTPARVESDGKAGLRFRLCKALPVPLYDPPPRQGHAPQTRRKARAVGAAEIQIKNGDKTPNWGALHGEEVIFTIRQTGRPPRTRPVVDTVRLADDAAAGDRGRRGWLSVTGRSIERKISERLFVPAGGAAIPVEEHHHAQWRAVLASYHDAAEYNEPGLDGAGQRLERPRHVILDGQVPERLGEGDLVYLERDHDTGAVTAILPVYIGRLPYQMAPAELLDESLHPATDPSELSPADRLFGWVPPESATGRAPASGYRGRFRITSVYCETSDWRTDFGNGVTLAPLGSPKPTQSRFYAASDPAGSPARRGTAKEEGYREGGGLRGRKAYWYPSAVPGEYWTPGNTEADVIREWQQPPDAKRSQTSTHLGWVREGTEFTIRLFIDAVPRAELAPLIWLGIQDGCSLRLGAGKPLGFGAVTVNVDWDATELRSQEALRGCWLGLRRPDPSPREQVEVLAAEFERQAMSSPALAPAITAFRKIAMGLPAPACYPRTQREPEAETYHWFVENDRIKSRRVRYGFALPHVLEENQDMPFLPRDTD